MKKLLSIVCASIMGVSMLFAVDISAAKKYEASSAYVNAIIEYCKASSSDPWNKDIISGIERCAKKLASGSWGKNYGCSADANVIKSWKEMEAVYQDFLSGAIRYTLTYTEKVKMEKVNDYDQAYESVRFKPKFSFKKNFPAESDIESAFSKLMKSDYALASQIKKYGKNVVLNKPTWKQPPREITKNVDGVDMHYFGPKYNVGDARDKSMPEVDVKNPDISNAGLMKSLKLAASEFKSWGVGISEYHMAPDTINYSKVSPYSWSGKYWIGWEPTVRVAVADRSGNRISNWSWWYPEDGFEIRVPLSKADKADHYIISDTWCMRGRGDGSITMTDLDFNYKPQSNQIIKK